MSSSSSFSIAVDSHDATRFISNKDYLEAAASILAVEAEHDAWVGSAVEQGSAWGTAYQTPLGLSGVFSLAGELRLVSYDNGHD
jgi:hypothetical protein